MREYDALWSNGTVPKEKATAVRWQPDRKEKDKRWAESEGKNHLQTVAERRENDRKGKGEDPARSRRDKDGSAPFQTGRKTDKENGNGPEEENAFSRLQEELKDTVENGSVTTDSGKHIIHSLTIIGQIEGHYALTSENKTTKYEHVIPQLVAIEESQEIEGVLILINTVGGDIEAGLALAELIAGMKKPTVSLVLGGGHSIGVPLAVAARRSFIVPSATMTIHPVRINGLVLGVPQAFTYFQKMQERITRFVAEHSHLSAERFQELCMETDELATDVGSVLEGKEAVAEGLIDELGSLSDALAALYQLIESSSQ